MRTVLRRRATSVARWSLVSVYAAAVVLCWHDADAPRLVWTVAMPIVPIGVVVIGFHTWRRICPLAAIARLGPRLGSGPRRAPQWLDRWSLLVAFALLAAALVARHLVVNGDAWWLGCGLVAAPVAAVIVNAVVSGKAWCNLVCPVGVVERVYTDGDPRPEGTTSRCSPCTGCKSRCPDIDQRAAYRSDLRRPALRIVTFALPGLVFGFYAYYALRFGEWNAFFDGRWTHSPFDRELLLGEGLHAVPGVPALAACPLVLIASAAASFAVFALLERLLSTRTLDAARLRHRLLTVASFCAFNLFYVFAGQPTLLEFPLVDRIVAFAVPVVATLALVRRWRAEPAGRAAGKRLPVV
jgi:hypothetical protein